MKKLISALLAGAMVLSLAACGSKPAPAPAASQPASSGSASASTAEPAIEPVKLTIYSPGNENSVPTKTIIEYARLVN